MNPREELSRLDALHDLTFSNANLLRLRLEMLNRARAAEQMVQIILDHQRDEVLQQRLAAILDGHVSLLAYSSVVMPWGAILEGEDGQYIVGYEVEDCLGPRLNGLVLQFGPRYLMVGTPQEILSSIANLTHHRAFLEAVHCASARERLELKRMFAPGVAET